GAAGGAGTGAGAGWGGGAGRGSGGRGAGGGESGRAVGAGSECRVRISGRLRIPSRPTTPPALYAPARVGHVGLQPLEAVRAHGMAELGAGVGLDVALELLPVPGVVADLLAPGAHRKQPRKALDLVAHRLQFRNRRVELAAHGRHLVATALGLAAVSNRGRADNQEPSTKDD